MASTEKPPVPTSDANPSDGNAYPLGVVAPPQHTGGASAQHPPGMSRVGSGQDLYGHRTDVPPKYATLPDAPPPTYDAIFGKVKQIQKDSLEKVGSCGDKTYQIFVSVLLRFVAFVLFIGVPVAMLVIGVLFLDDCPAATMIPIYLVVAGSTTAFYFLTVALRQVIKKIQKRRNSQSTNQEAGAPSVPPTADGEGDNSENKKKENHPCLDFFDGIMFLFLVGWFITGNVYIYQAWKDKPCAVYDCDPTKFCDPYLLLFSFWLITSIYITCGCCTCTCICIGCIGICASSDDDDKS